MNECITCHLRWTDWIDQDWPEQLYLAHDKEHLRLGISLPSKPQVMVAEEFGFKYWGEQK